MTTTEHMAADFEFMKACAAGVPFADGWPLAYAGGDYIFPYRIVDERGHVAYAFRGTNATAAHAEILGIGHAFRAAYEIAKGAVVMDFVAIERR